MTGKPKKTPKKELECPKKYVYDTGIIFECKDNIRVQIIGEDVVNLLNELTTKCSKLEKENNKIKNILLNKRKDLEYAYNCAAKVGMPTGGTIGELDTIEEILEEMGLKND